MKEKRFLPDGAVVYGALGLLLLLGVSAFVFRQDFSVWERRYLAEAPKQFSLSDWTLNEDLEGFLSDQIPFRRQLVNLDSSLQALTGRAVQLDAWPLGDAIVEKPVTAKEESLLRRVDNLRAFAGDIPCHFLTPPTAGMLQMDRMTGPRRAVYAQEAALYQALAAQPGFIPLTAFESSPDPVYYFTDHHWNGLGAYLAYRDYCRDAGIAPLEREAFELTEYGPFYGTTYSRSGLPFARADTLICAEPAGPITFSVQDDQATYDHLIFPEQAATYDGYAVYLNGNHGMLVVENPAAEKGTLFICKDSFANSVIPFLAAHYAKIVAVDARYYSGSFAQALQEAGPADEILFLYSLDSLANDTSIPRKLQRQ